MKEAETNYKAALKEVETGIKQEFKKEIVKEVNKKKKSKEANRKSVVGVWILKN